MGIVKLILLFMSLSFNSQPGEKSEAVYTVYVFLSEDCPICRYYVPTINELYSTFNSDQLQFVGVFPNFSSKPEKINAFVKDYKLTMPTQTDYFKKLSTELGATKTPEIIILNDIKDIIYKGRIDNAYAALGKRRRVVTEHDLIDILSKLQKGAELPFSETESIGCFINFSDLN